MCMTTDFSGLHTCKCVVLKSMVSIAMMIQRLHYKDCLWPQQGLQQLCHVVIGSHHICK